MTKKQREATEAWERIADSIRDCGPEGKATLLIQSVGRRPSSGGITELINVEVMRMGEDGRPEIAEWLSFNVAKAFGYRFNQAVEAISMGGYGYCRASEIASDLARKAGFAVRVQSTGFAFGPNGWHPKQARARVA